MAVWRARAVLCTCMLFVILPHLNLGLLSDLKICGDSECESLMSTVQAIRDHRGKDCRFLSFRRGDTISVYHKLTGKREDLWAGSIDKQFGYFPKDMVQEEQVFASTLKVVETQKSDFFCMDESGYLIDSSHLDSDDDDDDDDNDEQKTQNQESETSQTTPHTDGTNTESPTTSADPSPESPVSAQAADETSTEEDENRNAGDETPEEAPPAPNEQGGSASPSWLGSSVTGWLGLAKENEAGDLAEGEKEDERKETQAEASFTSSVTGWLGLGGEGKPEDGVTGGEEDRETADSLTSTMTGWLGFGGEKSPDRSAEKEQDQEREGEESGDKFRGRRMHLDLEGSQLYEEEEKKEMGTLDWLGNGLSNTLGFGLTNQESETTSEREDIEMIQEQEEQPEPSSWLDMGIGNILGFRKDKIEVDERTGSGYKETAEDKALEQPGDEDTSQALTEEGRTETNNESHVEESPKHQNAPPEIQTESETAELEDSSQAAFGLSLDETEEGDNVVDDVKKEKDYLIGERSTEVEDKDNRMLNSVENEGEDKREPQKKQKEESKTVSDTDQDSFTQSDISLESDFGSADLNSHSTLQPVGAAEEEKTDNMTGERAEIPNETEESSDTSVELGAGRDDHEGQVSSAAEESDEKSEPLSATGTTEEGGEPITGEDDSLTAHSVDDSDLLPVISDSTEAETHGDELGREGEVHHAEGSSQELGSSHSLFATNGNTTQMENNADQEAVSLQEQQAAAQSDGDAQELKESVKYTEKDNKDNPQQLHMETAGYENESGLKSPTGSETKAEEVEESSDEQRQGEEEELGEEEKLEGIKEVEEIKAQEKQQEEVEEEKQDEVKELKGEDGQQQVTEIEEEVKMKQEETEELKEGGTQEVAEELKEKNKQEGEEEVREDDSQEVLEELKEEKKQGEEEEKKDEMLEMKEEKKTEEVEEFKEEEKQMEEEDKKDELQEIKEEKKQEEVEELTEEEKQQQIGALQEEKELEDFKEEDETGELKEVEDIKENEKKEGEEEHAQSHSEVENVESDSEEKETHENNNLEGVLSETPTQMEEERRQEEDRIKDKMRDGEVEGVRRDKEEEGSLKCSSDLCPQAGEVGQRVGDGNDLAHEGVIEVEEPNPTADSSQILDKAVGSTGTERDRDRKQEEENRSDEAEAEEGKEEQSERKDSQSNHTGNEDVNSNHDNLIADLNALGINKTGEMEDNDLIYPGESGQNSLSDQILLGQNDDSKDEGAESVDLSDASRLGEGVKTKPEDNEASSSGISSEKITEQTHPDFETGTETSDPVESLISEQTVRHESQHPTGSSPLPDGHSEGTAKAEGGGAFGLFKNAFSFFGQTKESTESIPSLDSNTNETPKTQDSVTPEQDLDPTAGSSPGNTQDLPTDSPTSRSQQPSPPSPVHSHPSPLSPNTGAPLQTKTPSKHNKNLLSHVNTDEVAVLTELFGRHKLQFLDYVLGSSDTTTDDPDDDESILSDIERLLHYHRETLVAPSMRLTEAPQEDKEKTKTLIALQKLEILLARVRETFNTVKSDISNTNHQAETSCVGGSCSSPSKDEETTNEEESSMMGDSSGGRDNNSPSDGWMGAHRESEESLPHIQPGPQLEEILKQSLDFVCQMAADSATHVHAAGELLIWLTVQVVSSLPDDIRPGPDLYGVPWEPVIITSFVGLLTLLLFTCRCYSSVKSRMYRSKERWMAEQVAQLLEEKCKVLETLSTCQQEYEELEDSLRDSGVLAQTQKTEELERKAKQLGHANRQLERDLEQLKDQLDQQREHRTEQERRIAALEDSMKTCEEETKELQSQEEQAQTTLKVYSMNSDRLQKNLETAGEENTLLQESNAQLRQQVEGWAERVSELEAEMSRCEVSHSAMLQDVTTKDERIMSLTDRLLRMKGWDSELEEEEGEDDGEKDTSNGTAERGEENGRGDPVDTQRHLQKVQKLIYAAKLNADLKSVDEDKDRAFAKLNDEVKAKEDLQVSIKELENEKISLQSDTEHYTDQVQRLQQKLQIMTEMYQENELKLHRLLTVEEKERLQKEEKLHKADKNIAMAMEELNNYRQRAEEMEEELEKTKQSYQTQISAHEKKAHNNWLAARAADRELADIRRENALLRQKLTDTQFKLDALDKDPYALNSLARPLPFRAERSPYGPSPLGRPASETRAFLSPPTLMDGPPARLSPRVPRGPVEPPGGLGEMERSGGPHSDSGSISPTWERDRRGPPPGPPGPLGAPGYMFPEPGGPMYRRPPPPPLGLLPPPGSLPPGPLHPRGLPPGPPHPTDMADGSYRENSLGPGEQEHRESGPGDRRTPPDADPRMLGPPPPGPPMGPIDGPFPRRAPYGPPPPDFYPPRGPACPPMMPMWAPPPPGMMFPPRFPPGGPPLPHHAAPMRPPPPDGFPPPSMGPPPPQQSHPSPPHSQSPEEHTPSPEDAI